MEEGERYMKKWILRVLVVLGVVSVLGNVFLSVQLRNEKREVKIQQNNMDRVYKEGLVYIDSSLHELPSEPEHRQQKLAALIAYCDMTTYASFFSSYASITPCNDLTILRGCLDDLTENDAMWQEALDNDSFTELSQAVSGVIESLHGTPEAQKEALTELGELALSLQGEEQNEKPGS